MKYQTPEEISNVMDEYELAVAVVQEMPAGDLRAKRIFALTKSKNYILFLDKLSRDGRPIMEIVDIARESIKDVFKITEMRSTILPPALDIAKARIPLAPLTPKIK